jgi:ribosomal protein S27AE
VNDELRAAEASVERLREFAGPGWVDCENAPPGMVADLLAAYRHFVKPDDGEPLDIGWARTHFPAALGLWQWDGPTLKLTLDCGVFGRLVCRTQGQVRRLCEAVDAANQIVVTPLCPRCGGTGMVDAPPGDIARKWPCGHCYLDAANAGGGAG